MEGENQLAIIDYCGMTLGLRFFDKRLENLKQLASNNSFLRKDSEGWIVTNPDYGHICIVLTDYHEDTVPMESSVIHQVVLLTGPTRDVKGLNDFEEETFYVACERYDFVDVALMMFVLAQIKLGYPADHIHEIEVKPLHGDWCKTTIFLEHGCGPNYAQDLWRLFGTFEKDRPSELSETDKPKFRSQFLDRSAKNDHELAALRVIDNLLDRRGVGNELEAISYDIREELVQDVTTIIRDTLPNKENLMVLNTN